MNTSHTLAFIAAGSLAFGSSASVFYGTKSGSGTTVTDTFTWYANESCSDTTGVIPPTAEGASAHTYVILSAGKWQVSSSFPDVTTYIGTDGSTVGSSVLTAPQINMNCNLTVTFPHVTVFSGVFQANSDGNNPFVTLKGDYTFRKTTQPIEFRAANVNQNYSRGIDLAGTLHADSDAVLALTTSSACYSSASGVTGTFRISGDLSDFKGTFDVQTPTYTQYAKGSLTENLELTSATALGDNSSPRTDALTLHDKVHLKMDAGVTQSATRGITLAPGSSGQVYFTAEANKSWTLTAPLYGTSGTLVKEGAGTVILNGQTEIGAIAVTNGTLVLGSAFTFAPGSTVTVKNGGTLVTSFPQGLNVVIEDGGSFALAPIPYDPATDATTPVALTTGHAWSGRLAISLSSPIALPFTNEKRLLVLTVPQAVKTVTADDFTGATSRDEGLPVTHFEIETDASGLQSVYLVARPVLYSTDTNRSETNMQLLNGTTKWTDGLPVHGNADYAITNGAYLVTADQTVEEFTFPGSSLELSGKSRLHLKSHHTTLSNLIIRGGSRLTARGCGTGEVPHHVYGRIRVEAEGSTSQVDIPGWSSSTIRAGFDIHAAIIGSGLFQFGGSPACDFTVSSTNSTFKGRFGLGVGGGKDIAIRFAHPEAFGGALASYTYDAIGLYSSSNGIMPLASMTYAIPNRGLYLHEGGNFIATPDGVEFTFMNTIRTRRGFRKTGNGTLALGGSTAFGTNGTDQPNGTNNRLTVEAGFIKAVNTNGYESLSLTFAPGAGIAANAHPADSDVAIYGLCSSTAGRFTVADKLAVRLDGAGEDLKAGKSVRVAVCTVAAETADLTDSLTGIKPAARYVSRVTRETLSDGRTRYTMTFAQKGTLLVIR